MGRPDGIGTPHGYVHIARPWPQSVAQGAGAGFSTSRPCRRRVLRRHPRPSFPLP
jgi:hypothetical protein